MASIPDIASIYKQRQQENSQARRELLATIYSRCPELEDVESQLKQLELQKGMARVVHNQEWDEEDYQAKKLSLQERRSVLLKQEGLKADYAKEIFTCEACKDTGSILGEYCHCYKQLRAELIFQNSPIRKRLEYENFSRFDFSYFSDKVIAEYGVSPRENMQTIYDHAQDFVANFPAGTNLLLMGTTGTGKTFISSCIAYELLKKGYLVTYLSATEFFKVMADYAFQNGDKAEAEERYRYVFECDLLIIDDLGTEVTNQFVSSSLFEYLNSHALMNTSVIISTNLTGKQLEERYSKRVTSRISEMFVTLPMFGEDIRIKKNQM